MRLKQAALCYWIDTFMSAKDTRAVKSVTPLTRDIVQSDYCAVSLSVISVFFFFARAWMKMMSLDRLYMKEIWLHCAKPPTADCVCVCVCLWGLDYFEMYSSQLLNSLVLWYNPSDYKNIYHLNAYGLLQNQTLKIWHFIKNVCRHRNVSATTFQCFLFISQNICNANDIHLAYSVFTAVKKALNQNVNLLLSM